MRLAQDSTPFVVLVYPYTGFMNGNIEQQARNYHEQMPEDIQHLLSLHGLSRVVGQGQLLGWDGTSITVPIRDRNGRVAFLEYWWITDDGDVELSPIQGKVPVELVGWLEVHQKRGEIVVVQGILEYLVARSCGIRAVATSGNGLEFTDEWIEQLESFDRVYVCLKKHPSSRRIASWIAGSLSNSAMVDLPDECTSLSTFFVDHGLKLRDFKKLCQRSLRANRNSL